MYIPTCLLFFDLHLSFRHVNDTIMELLIMCYACKTSSCKNVIGVLPYLPYCSHSKWLDEILKTFFNILSSRYFKRWKYFSICLSPPFGFNKLVKSWGIRIFHSIQLKSIPIRFQMIIYYYYFSQNEAKRQYFSKTCGSDAD